MFLLLLVHWIGQIPRPEQTLGFSEKTDDGRGAKNLPNESVAERRSIMIEEKSESTGLKRKPINAIDARDSDATELICQ